MIPRTCRPYVLYRSCPRLFGRDCAPLRGLVVGMALSSFALAGGKAADAAIINQLDSSSFTYKYEMNAEPSDHPTVNLDGNAAGVIIIHEAGPDRTEAMITPDAVKKKPPYAIRLPACSLGLHAPVDVAT